MRDEKDLSGVRHVQVRMTEEEHKALKRKADDAGKRIQSFVRDLLTAASGREAATRVSPYSETEQAWIDKLIRVLRSPDEGAQEAVKRNLDTFERLVSMLERERTGRRRTA